MARREVLSDDFDLKEGTEDDPVLTWQVGIGPRNDYKTYTVDLRAENFAALEEALAPFLKNATPIQAPPASVRGRRQVTKSKPNDKGYTPAEVREWAAKEGIEVAPRGRIHKDVVEKYEYAKGFDKK